MDPTTGRAIRTRPLSVTEKLPVLWPGRQFDASTPALASLAEYVRKIEAAEASALTQVDNTAQQQVQAVNQPVAGVRLVADYASNQEALRHLPASSTNLVSSSRYIRHSSYIEDEGALPSEYDADEEDEEWLQQLNSTKVTAIRSPMNLDQFEKLVELFEVLDLEKLQERLQEETTSKDAALPPPSSTCLTWYEASCSVLNVDLRLARSVYDYWKEKRESSCGPLLQRLWFEMPWKVGAFTSRKDVSTNQVRPSSPSMPFAANVFADIGKRLMLQRFTHEEALDLMEEIRDDLELMRTMADQVRKREKLKRQLAQIWSEQMYLKYGRPQQPQDQAVQIPGQARLAAAVMDQPGQQQQQLAATPQEECTWAQAHSLLAVEQKASQLTPPQMQTAAAQQQTAQAQQPQSTGALKQNVQGQPLAVATWTSPSRHARSVERDGITCKSPGGGSRRTGAAAIASEATKSDVVPSNNKARRSCASPLSLAAAMPRASAPAAGPAMPIITHVQTANPVAVGVAAAKVYAPSALTSILSADASVVATTRKGKRHAQASMDDASPAPAVSNRPATATRKLRSMKPTAGVTSSMADVGQRKVTSDLAGLVVQASALPNPALTSTTVTPPVAAAAVRKNKKQAASKQEADATADRKKPHQHLKQTTPRSRLPRATLKQEPGKKLVSPRRIRAADFPEVESITAAVSSLGTDSNAAVAKFGNEGTAAAASSIPAARSLLVVQTMTSVTQHQHSVCSTPKRSQTGGAGAPCEEVNTKAGNTEEEPAHVLRSGKKVQSAAAHKMHGVGLLRTRILAGSANPGQKERQPRKSPTKLVHKEQLLPKDYARVSSGQEKSQATHNSKPLTRPKSVAAGRIAGAAAEAAVGELQGLTVILTRSAAARDNMKGNDESNLDRPGSVGPPVSNTRAAVRTGQQDKQQQQQKLSPPPVYKTPIAAQAASEVSRHHATKHTRECLQATSVQQCQALPVGLAVEWPQTQQQQQQRPAPQGQNSQRPQTRHHQQQKQKQPSTITATVVSASRPPPPASSKQLPAHTPVASQPDNPKISTGRLQRTRLRCRLEPRPWPASSNPDPYRSKDAASNSHNAFIRSTECQKTLSAMQPGMLPVGGCGMRNNDGKAIKEEAALSCMLLGSVEQQPPGVAYTGAFTGIPPSSLNSTQPVGWPWREAIAAPAAEKAKEIPGRGQQTHSLKPHDRIRQQLLNAIAHTGGRKKRSRLDPLALSPAAGSEEPTGKVQVLDSRVADGAASLPLSQTANTRARMQDGGHDGGTNTTGLDTDGMSTRHARQAAVPFATRTCAAAANSRGDSRCGQSCRS